MHALGRLEDAAELSAVSVKLNVEQEDWKKAGGQASNLSELLVTIGELAGEGGAVAWGDVAVAFADRSGDVFERISERSTLADALFQEGSLAWAEALFRESEALQKEIQPDLPRLYSGQGHNIALCCSPAAVAQRPPPALHGHSGENRAAGLSRFFRLHLTN